MADDNKSFMSKFKLNKHNRIERFGVVFGLFTAIFALMLIVSFNIHLDNKKLKLTEQALYTRDAQFSLSEDAVGIREIYRSSDFTRAFVLLEIKNPLEAFTKISYKAEDYQVFMTGYKGAKLTNADSISCTIYMFGTDGYIGLYFVNPTGFDSQLYDVVLRNTQMMVEKPEKNPSAFPSSSYAYHNQLHFYANFAGTAGVVSGFLNQPDFTFNEMVASVLSYDNQQDMKSQLEGQLVLLNKDMKAINSWADKLKELNVQVPALPPYIDGDAIVTDPEISAKNPVYYTNSMDKEVSTSYNSFETVDITDEVKTVDLYLSTQYVYMGGMQFDYQPVALYDKVEDIIKGKKEYPSIYDLPYNEEGHYALQGYSDWWELLTTQRMVAPPLVKNNMFTYYTVDGHMLSEEESYVKYGETATATQTAIAGFETTVQQYLNDKHEYQVNLLPEFINEKHSTEDRAGDYSVRGDDKTLIIY